MISIHACNYEALTSKEVDLLYDLMIYAYARTEIEIWGHDYKRMNRENYDELMKKEGFLIAYLNGQIVGSVYSYSLPENKYGFGLLNSDFSHAGKGIGTALVKAVENLAKKKGASSMSIEILRPKNFKVENKEKLKDWYITLGYSFIITCDFIELKPNEIVKSKRMINPSVFDVYNKEL